MTDDEVPISTKKKETKISKQNQERGTEEPCRRRTPNPFNAPSRIERVQSEAVGIGARDAA